MSDIRIRAKASNGETEVKALMTHPMESGLRKDSETNALIPAHFIKEVVCKWKDEVVLTANWSGGVSKNPYLAFRFKGGAPGEPVTLTWTDTRGETQTATAEIAA